MSRALLLLRGGRGTPAASYDFLVSNDSELTDALSNATTGQSIGVLPGAYASRTVTSAASGITMKSTVRLGAVFPKFTLTTTQDFTFEDFSLQADDKVNEGYLFNTSGNCGGLTLRGNQFRCGNTLSTANFEDIDPTAHYDVYGTTGDWAVGSESIARQSGFNTTGWQGTLLIEDNDFVDLNHCIKFTVTGAVSSPGIRIYNNRLGRFASDAIGVSVYQTAPSAPEAFEVVGNVFYDNYSQPQDRGNPHSDLVQYSGDDGGVGAAAAKFELPLPGILIAGNISFQRPGARGQPQRFFMSDVASGGPFWAPVVVDNLMLSRITNKGVTFYAPDDNSGVYSAYIYRNTIATNPAYNAAIDNELLTNTVTNKGPSSPSAATIITVGDPLYPSKHLVEGNITESITAQDWTQGPLSNVTLGRGTSATSYATWYDAGSTEWNDMDTADKAVSAFTPKVAYADLGAVRAGDTAATLIARWLDPATRPYASLPAFAGVQDQQDVLQSTQITSAPAYCFAWGGRSISVASGLEWRTTTDYAGSTVSQDWTSAGGTVQHGEYLWLRLTSSASVGTTVEKAYTLDGDAYTWSVTTASANDWPAVTLDGTAYWTKANTTALASDSPLGTFFIRFRHSSTNPAATRTLYVGAGFSATLLTTGVLRVSHGGGRIDTSIDVCDDKWHDILFSWDVSQSDQSLGRKCYVDGVDRTNASAQWTGGDGVTNAYGTTGAPLVLGTSGATAKFPGDFAALWFLPGVRVDITSATLRTQFYRENIGLNGTGPTGSSPPVFITGTSAQLVDAGGVNFGTAAKFTKTAGNNPTDLSGSTWA